jgi:YD repeat-containing protein
MLPVSAVFIRLRVVFRFVLLLPFIFVLWMPSVSQAGSCFVTGPLGYACTTGGGHAGHGSAGGACKAHDSGGGAGGGYCSNAQPGQIAGQAGCSASCSGVSDPSGECVHPDDAPDCDEATDQPIVLSTGEKIRREVDYRFAGENPLTVERQYSYAKNEPGRWRFNYTQSMTSNIQLDGSALLINDRGLDGIFYYRAVPASGQTLSGLTVNATSAIGPTVNNVSAPYKYSPYKLTVAFKNTPMGYDSVLRPNGWPNYGAVFFPESYLLELPDGSTETYDASGKLTEIVHANGQKKIVSYLPPPSAGLPEILRVADDSTGYYLDYMKIQNGNGPGGTTWLDVVVQLYAIESGNPVLKWQALYDFLYSEPDPSGTKLMKVTLPDGVVAEYTYGANNRLLSQSERTATGDGTALANYITWGYDDSGHANHSHLGPDNSNGAEAESADIEYSFTNSVLTKATRTNAKGLETNYEFELSGPYGATVLKHVGGNTSGSCAPPDSYMTYDSNRLRTTLTTGALDNDNNGTPESEGSVTRYIRHSTRPHLVTETISGLTWNGSVRPWSAGEPPAPTSTSITDYTRRVVTTWHANKDLPVTREYYGVATGSNTLVNYRTETLTYDDGTTSCSNTGTTWRVCSRTVTDNQTSPSADELAGAREWAYSYTINSTTKKVTSVTETNPRNQVTTYTYDSQGLLSSVKSPSVNSLQLETTFSNFNAFGLPQIVTDVNNNVVTTLTYNGRGQLTGTTMASATTGITYWPNGLVKAVTQPDGIWLEYSYNAARHLTSVRNHKGEHVDYTPDLLHGDWEKATTYKASGTASENITLQQHRLFDAMGRLWKQNDASNNEKIVYLYDQNDNLRNIIELGSGVTNAYDNNSRVVSRAYDGGNRLISESRCTSEDEEAPEVPYSCAGELATTTYTHDVQGNVASVVVSNATGGNQTTTYAYNGFGELVEQVSPDTGTTKYAYDMGGNLIAKTKGFGTADEQAIAYTYDALDRLTAINYPNTAQDVTYTWDQASHGSGLGRLTSVTDEGGSTHYHYNAHGLITSKVFDPIGSAPALTTGYAYMANGTRLEVMTLPGGQQVKYGRHETRKDITSLTTNNTTTINSSENILTTITHRPFGGVSGWQTNSGGYYKQERSYDQDGLLAERTMIDGNDAEIAHTYEYDAYRQIMAHRRTGNPLQDEVYEYDALARLSKVTADYGRITYGYDDVGNRTSRLMERQNPTGWAEFYTEAYTYTANSNKLGSVTRTRGTTNLRSRTLGYDARGNISTDTRSTTVNSTTTTNALDLDYGNSDRLNSVDVEVQP